MYENRIFKRDACNEVTYRRFRDKRSETRATADNTKVLSSVGEGAIDVLEKGRTTPNQSGINSYIRATQKHSSEYGTKDIFQGKQTRVEKSKVTK